MKDNIINAIKIVLADRVVTVLLIGLALVCMAFCVFIGLSLHPSDLQVAVRYTAFGETHFYREKWYYLISFIVFGVMVAVIHGAIAVKLYIQERRQLAIFFIWLSVLMIVIAWLLANAILRIAFR